MHRCLRSFRRETIDVNPNFCRSSPLDKQITRNPGTRSLKRVLLVGTDSQTFRYQLNPDQAKYYNAQYTEHDPRRFLAPLRRRFGDDKVLLQRTLQLDNEARVLLKGGCRWLRRHKLNHSTKLDPDYSTPTILSTLARQMGQLITCITVLTPNPGQPPGDCRWAPCWRIRSNRLRGGMAAASRQRLPRSTPRTATLVLTALSLARLQGR